jgi:hypothetical protein
MQRLCLKKCESGSEGMCGRIRWLFSIDDVSNCKEVTMLSTIILLGTLPIVWLELSSHV